MHANTMSLMMFNEDPSTLSQNLETRIRKTEASANMLATCHAFLQDSFTFFSILLTITSLIGSTLLLTLSLVDEKLIEPFVRPVIEYLPFLSAILNVDLSSQIKLLMAFLALVTFIATLVDLASRPAQRSNTHKKAVDHYVQCKAKFRRLRLTYDLTDPQTTVRFEQIETHYLNREEIPSIPEVFYPVLKLWHEIKTLIADAMTGLFQLIRLVSKALIHLISRLWREAKEWASVALKLSSKKRMELVTVTSETTPKQEISEIDNGEVALSKQPTENRDNEEVQKTMM